MKKDLHQKIIHKVRSLTPLILRQKIGPVLARVYYVDRLYLRPHSGKPNILSIEETIDTIIQKNLSVIRFGDGEVTLLEGSNLSFQKKNDNLLKRLEEIIKIQKSGLLICIPGIWGRLDIFAPFARRFIMHHMYRYRHIWRKLLAEDAVYGDSYITRHYLAFEDKTNAGENFKNLFKIWEGKKVVLIEGEKSRLGVGNDMFDNVTSLQRILCPAENAYTKYEIIKNEALKINKNILILISLGPTAKVLAYDLFTLGYRVIDIGHIDMEYEMFLRKEMYQTKVLYKYFNEINERTPEDCTDEIYLKQIITTVS